MRVVINEAFLRRMINLENENVALKKQVNDSKVRGISKEVAGHIDNWLDTPYQDDKTKSQDIDNFALKITKYIDYRLRD